MIARFSQIGRFFTKLGGCRKKLPNEDMDCAIVYCWEQSILTPAKHSALEIRKGKQSYYLSFSPFSTSGIESFADLTTGREAFFAESLEEEQLVRGYRRYKIDDQKFQEKKRNYFEILHKARSYSDNKQEEIKALGAPDQEIVLRSLNLDEMIKRIREFKAELPKTQMTESEVKEKVVIPSYKSQWASLASVFSLKTESSFNKEKPHNCASMVLDVLYAGGLGDLIPTSSQDVAGAMGFVLGAASFVGNANFMGAAINLTKTFFVCRGIGGAYVGWNESQSVLDLTAVDKTKKGEKESCSTVLGLRFLFTATSVLIALLKPGYFFSEWLVTTPQGVMDRVMAAKKEEDAIYLPKEQKEMKTIVLGR